MTIIENMKAYGEKPQAEQDADFQKLLAELAGIRAQEAKQPRRTFRDQYINSNINGGGL